MKNCEMTRVLAALAHPARIAMLRQLCGCECACCGDMKNLTGLAQSTTSQHLRVLLDAGLIERKAAGTANHYRLSKKAAEMLRRTGEMVIDLAPRNGCGQELAMPANEKVMNG